MPADEAAPNATEEPEKNAAVRAYLSATIMPTLLKGLIEMEKEECVSRSCPASPCLARSCVTARASPMTTGASGLSCGSPSTLSRWLPATDDAMGQAAFRQSCVHQPVVDATVYVSRQRMPRCVVDDAMGTTWVAALIHM